VSKSDECVKGVMKGAIQCSRCCTCTIRHELPLERTFTKRFSEATAYIIALQLCEQRNDEKITVQVLVSMLRDEQKWLILKE
jgi:hypothetical protein